MESVEGGRSVVEAEAEVAAVGRKVLAQDAAGAGGASGRRRRRAGKVGEDAHRRQVQQLDRVVLARRRQRHQLRARVEAQRRRPCRQVQQNCARTHTRGKVKKLHHLRNQTRKSVRSAHPRLG